jgi:hypothetical protein
MEQTNSLLTHFHTMYLQRMENELGLHWRRLNIGLVALIASIAGYGVLVTKQLEDGSYRLIAPPNGGLEQGWMFAMSSLAVLTLVAYMMILVNQGRYWYQINEIRVAWIEKALFRTVSSVTLSESPTSLYQIGNGHSGWLTVNKGVKIPLFATGLAFSAISGGNISSVIAIAAGGMTSAPYALSSIGIGLVVIFVLYRCDRNSRGELPGDCYRNSLAASKANEPQIMPLLRNLATTRSASIDPDDLT